MRCCLAPEMALVALAGRADWAVMIGSRLEAWLQD